MNPRMIPPFTVRSVPFHFNDLVSPELPIAKVYAEPEYPKWNPAALDAKDVFPEYNAPDVATSTTPNLALRADKLPTFRFDK